MWVGRALVPFASLRNYNFRMLWLGQLGQASAMWAEQVARNWLTWQLTESATALGLVNVARALPLIVLGLFGGVIADRFDKRRTLIVIQMWSLSIYVAMAVLILGGWLELWHVYLTAFLLGAGMALNQPVRTSFIPQLLHGDLLLNALSLNSIAINVTRLVGPAAIGFLIAAFNDNVGPSYVVASAVYVLVIVSTLMIRSPGVQREGRAVSMGSDLVEGFRYMLLENRTVLALIVVAMGPLAFGFSYITLLPVFVTEVLDMGPAGFGTIQSAAAVGALAGGFTLASMGHVRRKGQTMLVAGLAYGVVLMLLSVVSAPMLAFMAVPIIGAAQTVFRAANNSALLEITPGRLRGRVMSMTFLDTGVQSLAAIMAGSITDTWSVAVGMVLLGAVCALIVGAIGIAVPSVRRL